MCTDSVVIFKFHWQFALCSITCTEQAVYLLLVQKSWHWPFAVCNVAHHLCCVVTVCLLSREGQQEQGGRGTLLGPPAGYDVLTPVLPPSQAAARP